MKYFNLYGVICLVLLSCKGEVTKTTDLTVINSLKDLKVSTDLQSDYRTLLLNAPEYIANGFDFPVGKPDGKGYYNAQKFQVNNHLGDDWNGVGGGNSDLGDPVFAIANGYISEVKDYKGGWGNVVRVVHLYKDKLYESLYAHCDSILVAPDQFIKKGTPVATIGNCDGIYYAHLHLEIRSKINLDIGSGYSKDTTGYLDPTAFIDTNRN